MVDFDKAFKETPVAFSEGVSSHLKALQKMEEKPVKHKSFSVILIAALVIIAMAATALAVANRAGLLYFFSSWKEQDIPQTPTEFTQVLNGDTPLLRTEYDDLIVTVTEAAGEGRWYYFNTTIELKPGVEGYLVNMSSANSDVLSLVANAKHDKPVYIVDDYIMHGEATCDSGDRTQNEDGSVSSLNIIYLVEAADVAQMGCYITYVKSEPGVLPDGTDNHTTIIPFEIPMPKPTDTRKIVEPVSFEELGITLDELYFKKTQEAIYCFTYLQYEGGEQVGYKLPYGRNQLTLRVLDENGEQVLIPRLRCEWVSGTYFSGYNVSGFDIQNMDTLPNRVVLEVIDDISGIIYESVTIDLLPGELALENLSAYRESPEAMLDLHDMCFPWSDIWFNGEYGYLSADEKGAQIYIDPRDPSTLVGTFYSGLKVRPNITYKGWTTIYFGDSDNTYTRGYILSDSLVHAREDARPGIPVGHVNGDAGEMIGVRMRPTEASTVQAAVAGLEEVLVVGEMNGWYHIAREDEYGMRVIGYVPVELISLTEERVSMR